LASSVIISGTPDAIYLHIDRFLAVGTTPENSGAQLNRAADETNPHVRRHGLGAGFFLAQR
jgi:hypothetical protein